jgi:hypothetical protein
VAQPVGGRGAQRGRSSREVGSRSLDGRQRVKIARLALYVGVLLICPEAGLSTGNWESQVPTVAA